MSEFSESLHFRPLPDEHEDALRAALRASPLQGVLFPATAQWRTFTPFESGAPGQSEAESTGAVLSLIVDRPVLEYHFEEDIYWGFIIWSGGELASMYLCEFKRRTLKIDAEVYDPRFLAEFLPQGTTSDALDAVLSPSPRTPDGGRAAAGAFAERLKLENVEWLGPSTIVDVLASVRDTADVVVLGSPPPPAINAKRPANVKTSTPFSREHHDWTAHEALEQLFPLALEWSPDAEVMHVCSSPLEGTADEREATGVWIDDRGRTTLTGGWSVTFKSATRGQFANLSLVIPTARVVRLADTFPHYEFTGELRDDWIDSSAVIALTEPMYAARRSGETPRLHHRGLDLRMTEQGSRWRVLYMCWERGKERVDFEFLIDARSGEVLPA